MAPPSKNCPYHGYNFMSEAEVNHKSTLVLRFGGMSASTRRKFLLWATLALPIS